MPEFDSPFHLLRVTDDNGVRLLKFERNQQSSMRIDDPFETDISYVGYLHLPMAVVPEATRALVIGLGGGSIAKFCNRFLPASHMTVLEINPYVLALRREFQVPDDDARFQVIAADAALYLRTEAPQYEVLLVDGFDHEGQPAALCTQRFYDDCLAALPTGGLLVVNLHYDHPDYPVLVERISRSFNRHAVEVITQEKTNSIVFARKGLPISPRCLNLRHSLAGLENAARSELRAELARMLWQMKSLDPKNGD